MHAEFVKRFGKSDKMKGLPSMLLLFRNMFNKFNNTGARILDFIYYMTLQIHKNHIFCMNVIVSHYEICNHQWFINFIMWRYITPRGNVMC